jgi:hypothetical protein
MQKEIIDYPFEIEDTIIFRISFGGYAWYFREHAEAFILLDWIVSTKTRALIDKEALQKEENVK